MTTATKIKHNHLILLLPVIFNSYHILLVSMQLILNSLKTSHHNASANKKFSFISRKDMANFNKQCIPGLFRNSFFLIKNRETSKFQLEIA